MAENRTIEMLQGLRFPNLLCIQNVCPLFKIIGCPIIRHSSQIHDYIVSWMSMKYRSVIVFILRLKRKVRREPNRTHCGHLRCDNGTFHHNYNSDLPEHQAARGTMPSKIAQRRKQRRQIYLSKQKSQTPGKTTVSKLTFVFSACSFHYFIIFSLILRFKNHLKSNKHNFVQNT